MTKRLLFLLALAPLALACTKEVVCPQGEAVCGGRCVALQTDVNHCGACGMQCGPGVGCVDGACQCPPEMESCDGGCFDVSSAPAHCGACAGPGVACADGQVCSEGACAASCAAGLTDCDSACVDLATSREHCGACGVGCGAGESCLAGECRSLRVACFATNDVRAIGPDFWSRGAVRTAGDGPIALTVVGDDVWVANSLSHSLSELPLDPALPGTEHAVPAASDFEGITSHAGLLLVSNSGIGTLLVYDPATAKVVDEIVLGGTADVNPRGVAVVGDRAFVALYGADELSGGQSIAVLDVSGMPACATAEESPPACGEGGACETGRVCRSGSCVRRCGVLESTIDLRVVEAASDAPGLPFPVRAVAVDGKVYVTLANMKKATTGPLEGFYVDPAGPARLAVVDTTAADAVSIVSLGACRNAGALGHDGARLWVACGDAAAPGLLPVALDGGTPAPGELVTVPVGAPGNLAFCGGMGYVTDQWSGNVIRFDPEGVEAPVSASPCPDTTGQFPWAWAADVACAP